jgi:hypothetical protein
MHLVGFIAVEIGRNVQTGRNGDARTRRRAENLEQISRSLRSFLFTSCFSSLSECSSKNASLHTPTSFGRFATSAAGLRSRWPRR